MATNQNTPRIESVRIISPAELLEKRGHMMHMLEVCCRSLYGLPDTFAKASFPDGHTEIQYPESYGYRDPRSSVLSHPSFLDPNVSYQVIQDDPVPLIEEFVTSLNSRIEYCERLGVRALDKDISQARRFHDFISEILKNRNKI